jgi:hypothetical protein
VPRVGPAALADPVFDGGHAEPSPGSYGTASASPAFTTTLAGEVHDRCLPAAMARGSDELCAGTAAPTVPAVDVGLAAPPSKASRDTSAPATTPTSVVRERRLPDTVVRALEGIVHDGLKVYPVDGPLQSALRRSHYLPAASSPGPDLCLSPLELVGIFAYRQQPRVNGAAPRLNKLAFALTGALLDLIGLPSGADVTLDTGHAAEG